MWTRRKGRLERTSNANKRQMREQVANFGHNFVLTMYKTLFPYISADNRSLDEEHNANLLNNCFENGAFVFKDTGRVLFNYLINGAENGLGKMHAKTHLMPREIWKKQENWRDDIRRHYDNINFIFYGGDGKETKVNMRKYTFGMGSHFNNKDIKQYELKISPPIKYLCNPECDNATLNLKYCGHGDYKGAQNGQRVGLKPGPGKKVIKFYCYGLEYIKRGKVILFEGPFTYIKLESKALTRAAGGNLLNIAHHAQRNKTKKSSMKEEGGESKIKMATGECWRKSNSRYCYRAEDYGWFNTIQPNPKEEENIMAFNQKHNYFPMEVEAQELTPNDKREINEYALNTNRKTNADGRQLDKYKLRTGFELYVPQTLTTRIYGNLRNMGNFSVGERVEVYWDADDRWYPAQIQRRATGTAPGTFSVQYDDNDARFTSGLLGWEIRHRNDERNDGGGDGIIGGHRKRRRTRKRRRRKTRTRRRRKTRTRRGRKTRKKRK